MTALYALPDHQVVAGLLPGIGARLLGRAEATARMHAVPGLVPVAIDPGAPGQPETGLVYWADIGDHPYREWQFLYSIEHLAQKGAIVESFSSEIGLLADDALFGDGIAPSGLIFHISRCGSTLLAKALARSPRHIVVNQGGALQRGFWAWATGDFTRPLEASPQNLRMFRNLVLAMARRRRGDEIRSFVKFISWNTLYLDFIEAAFPDVPALFLYREPCEVVMSVMKETTAALEARGTQQAEFLTGAPWQSTAAMDDAEYLGRCYRRYFEVALAAGDRVATLNYRDISPVNFPDILRRGLGFVPDDQELGLMLEQFRFHSKDDGDRKLFADDSAAKQAAASADQRTRIDQICEGLVETLDQRPANLYAPTRKSAPGQLAANGNRI